MADSPEEPFFFDNAFAVDTSSVVEIPTLGTGALLAQGLLLLFLGLLVLHRRRVSLEA